jgi:hypothetical protein
MIIILTEKHTLLKVALETDGIVFSDTRRKGGGPN